jgi:hypothetical protein
MAGGCGATGVGDRRRWWWCGIEIEDEGIGREEGGYIYWRRPRDTKQVGVQPGSPLIAVKIRRRTLYTYNYNHGSPLIAVKIRRRTLYTYNYNHGNRVTRLHLPSSAHNIFGLFPRRGRCDKRGTSAYRESVQLLLLTSGTCLLERPTCQLHVDSGAWSGWRGKMLNSAVQLYREKWLI